MKAAAKEPDGLKKTVFELQTVNWKNQQKIPSNVFIEQLNLLKKLGVKHIGYYPDNVYENQPKLEDLQQHFSLPELQ
jgi:biofilm PGA synthesis lipoprotein PgaB